MGYAISWLAFENRRPEQVQRLLALRGSGETSDVPENEFNGAPLPRGWYLVFINEADHAFVRPGRLAELSTDGRVIVVSIEEHVMECRASAWQDGREVWTVAHSSEEGADHVDARGDLPESYAGIRDRLVEKQTAADATEQDVDYLFDLPLELAAAITGYRHDRIDGLTFETLVPGESDGRGFFARWFR